MTFVEARYSEHPRYPEFLAGFSSPEEGVIFATQSDDFKKQSFGYWLLRVEKEEEEEEDIQDFKDLVPMHIRMNAEEWDWFKARLDEEYTEKLPNLRALAAHPPAAFKDFD